MRLSPEPEVSRPTVVRAGDAWGSRTISTCCPAIRPEVDLMRTVENTEAMRSALLDLDARISEMDTIGQDMAVFSLNSPRVQPYRPAAAIRLAREFNSALSAIVRERPARFGGLGTVAP